MIFPRLGDIRLGNMHAFCFKQCDEFRKASLLGRCNIPGLVIVELDHGVLQMLPVELGRSNIRLRCQQRLEHQHFFVGQVGYPGEMVGGQIGKGQVVMIPDRIGIVDRLVHLACIIGYRCLDPINIIGQHDPKQRFFFVGAHRERIGSIRVGHKTSKSICLFLKNTTGRRSIICVLC